MAFDSTLVNFLTVGNFASDPTYGLPLSQQLLTSSVYGLTFANAGSGSTYTLQTTGNMLSLMALQQNASYGVVISVPQGDGGLITRTLAGSSSVSISDPAGAAGNPTLSVTPSSTVQLINTRIGGSVIGSARSTLNFIQGTNIGLNAVDTGTVTDITISSVQDPLLASGPFVITQASAGLTGASNLGALATGYVFSTVSAGVSTLSTVSSIPAASIAGTAVTLSDVQTISSVKTFTSKQVFTNSIQIPTGAGVNKVLGSDASGNAAWIAAGAGDAILAANQTFTGIDTFTQPPVMSGASIANASIPSASISGTAVTLTNAETIASVKTFTPQQIFTNSIQIPLGATNGYVLTSDSSGNAAWTAPAGGASLSANQTFTGINTFSQPPVMSGASITSGTIPAVSVTGTAVTLSGAQSISGVKTFTPQQIFTNSIQIPLGATAGYVLTSDASGNMTLAPNTGSFLSSTVSTTDATPTTLATIAIASNTAVTFSGTISGRNTSGSINNACGGRFNVVAINTAGTVTLAATADVTVQSTSTATFNVVVSGTNLILRVTGIAATPYNWAASYTTISL